MYINIFNEFLTMRRAFIAECINIYRKTAPLACFTGAATGVVSGISYSFDREMLKHYVNYPVNIFGGMTLGFLSGIMYPVVFPIYAYKFYKNITFEPESEPKSI